jgi:AcrR family transcriptional regulator
MYVTRVKVKRKTATKAEQAAATRARLIRVARPMFSARGFAGVSAEELVARARVTRGALYHHFDGKEGLFEAVLDEVMRELHARLVAEAARFKDPVAALEHSIGVFLKLASEPDTQRVLLIDGPAVLGWARWRAMDESYGLGLLKRALGAAASAGTLKLRDPDVASHLLLGALTEGAMVVARSPHPTAAMRAAEEAAVAIVEGWRS